MLTNWLKQESQEPAVDADAEQKATVKRASALRGRLLEFDHEPSRELSADEKAQAHEDKLKMKLRNFSMTKHKKMIPYDNVFRAASSLLLEGHGDFTDGFNVNVSRPVHNTMPSIKWHFANAHHSNWEVSAQMNGFSELFNATYSTAKRWQLMYQKTFTAGALLIAQMMAQPSMAVMGAPASTFFGLLYYPWCPGGCTAMQYIKGQHVATSHMQQIIRGVYVGSQMTYDMNTNDSSMSYAFYSPNIERNMEYCGEIKPSSGEWKVSVIKQDWANDLQVCTQLEQTETQQGPTSSMSFGVKKQLIGGGFVQAVLAGFSKLRATVELPFGGERTGFNAVSVQYQLQYDLASADVKQGFTMTY